jgi:hypothetical protein
VHDVALLEGEPRSREPGARTRGARRMFAHEALQMLERRLTIASCLFQLGERE